MAKYNSMAFSGVVHLDPTNPNKIFNPDTGRYVYMDKEIGQSLLRKYGRTLMKNQDGDKVGSVFSLPLATKTIDYDALDIIQNQISQYKEYVAKEPYHEAAEMILKALTEIQKSFENIQGHQSQTTEKIQDIISELIEVFNALQEHGFRLGPSKYPGPNNTWKSLVQRYLKQHK